jgi:acyl-homoserine lactone acylase PvdQ
MAKGINERVAKMLVLPHEFYLTGLKWENFTVNHIFILTVQFEWAISMNLFDEYTRSALLANYTKEELDWIIPNKKENWAF